MNVKKFLILSCFTLHLSMLLRADQAAWNAAFLAFGGGSDIAIAISSIKANSESAINALTIAKTLNTPEAQAVGRFVALNKKNLFVSSYSNADVQNAMNGILPAAGTSIATIATAPATSSTSKTSVPQAASTPKTTTSSSSKTSTVPTIPSIPTTATYVPVQQPVAQNTMMITNNATELVYLIVLDQSGQRINPTDISLAPAESSYIPANAATVQIINSNHQYLIFSSSMHINNHYTLTNIQNIWNISSTSINGSPANYSYKNATNIPLIIKLQANNIVYSQQVAPGSIYMQPIDPSTIATIEAHANIASINQSYNPQASYALTINGQNQLALTQSAGNNNILINNSGWPMFISITLSDNTYDYIILEDGHQCQPANSSMNISVTPFIQNSVSTPNLIKSCTISNASGKLSLQF